MAYLIESAAAGAAKKTIGLQKKTAEEKEYDQKVFQSTWPYTAFLHTANATLCLAVTSFVVYFYIHHPGIGTICELHAIIVWLKNCSFAFTNRDLRLALLNPSADPGLPEIYSSCPYPRNITISNLSYFWLAPTLVYQPVYPRTSSIRWSFVAKRLAEFAGLSVFIWLLSAQYAAPVLRNSIEKIAVMDIASILERVMKLSTISLVIWLAGFFALFQALMNALAEVMRFGDREFYTDWWNSSSLGMYWRSWNRPVYLFMKRHVYSPLVGRGWSPLAASGVVFALSAILHEMLVGIPTHNFIGIYSLSFLWIYYAGTDVSPFRSRIRGDDVPATPDRPHRAFGEKARSAGQDDRELYFLGELLSCGPAPRGALVLFRVAGQVRQREQDAAVIFERIC